MQTTEIRVLIYPYIPDLNRDGLKQLRNYIKIEFEAQFPNVKVQVDGDPNTTDPYLLDNLKAYLGTASDAYDLVEVDTIMLGEMVKNNL